MTVGMHSLLLRVMEVSVGAATLSPATHDPQFLTQAQIPLPTRRERRKQAAVPQQADTDNPRVLSQAGAADARGPTQADTYQAALGADARGPTQADVDVPDAPQQAGAEDPRVSQQAGVDAPRGLE
ncbi:MAG: hypothetical protein Q9226_004883 [Calogaya cf. arnoldii]